MNADPVIDAMKAMADEKVKARKEPDLRATGLVKVYGDRTVVNGMSLDVNCGEIVGLLGPNGAGKTTTFYMVVGLVKPDGGKVVFRGKAEPFLKEAAAYDRFQFMRLGYYMKNKKGEYNLIVGLKDSYKG